MKKLLTLTLVPLTLLSLTTVARADVIAGPAVTAAIVAVRKSIKLPVKAESTPTRRKSG